MPSFMPIWLAIAAQVSIGALFLVAGISKLRDLEGTTIAILAYQIIPVRMVPVCAVLLGTTEVITGSGLILGITLAYLVCVILLCGFSVALTSALARHLDVNCHCFGKGEAISYVTVSRDLVIAAVLAIIFLELPSNHALLASNLGLATVENLASASMTMVAIWLLYAVWRVARPRIPAARS